ncbi:MULTISPECIES: hypothetical protein [unclassified Ruminococcus]|uniref:hypothetical protein n=1 Tax=unclassified Ruminococcus TaxID=2608920 RepID=UPI00210A33C6|nr:MULTISPECIES: hypothetical protein [unclassified Ruminococcus]MCQ4022613.1 hypothetical protein [Ruminococcus sp. zg-924]MCQ4114853.1 hypothetical protein [Ruminococcus sp. zg-921]
MLCVKPTNDEKLKSEILSKNEIFGAKPDVLTAVESGRLLGYVAVDPIDRELRLANFNITDCDSLDNPSRDNLEIAEYLLRAAGNYAYNRLMLTLSCEIPEYKPILKRFGFEEINNKFQLDIKVLFKKCENCASGH